MDLVHSCITYFIVFLKCCSVDIRLNPKSINGKTNEQTPHRIHRYVLQHGRLATNIGYTLCKHANYHKPIK